MQTDRPASTGNGYFSLTGRSAARFLAEVFHKSAVVASESQKASKLLQRGGKGPLFDQPGLVSVLLEAFRSDQMSQKLHGGLQKEALARLELEVSATKLLQNHLQIL